MAGRKFKEGDTVKVVDGSYKGKKGVIIDYTPGDYYSYSSTKGYYTVRLNGHEGNKDFYSSQLELVNTLEPETEESIDYKWHIASKVELQEAYDNNRSVLIRPDLNGSTCTWGTNECMINLKGTHTNIRSIQTDNGHLRLKITEDQGYWTWCEKCFAIIDDDPGTPTTVSSNIHSTIKEFNLGEPVGRKRRTLF